VWVDVVCRSRRSGFCPCGAGEPTTPAGETCPGQAATRSARAPSLDRRRWRPGRRGRTFGVRRKDRTEVGGILRLIQRESRMWARYCD
jgi:hypothetical protein